MRDWYVLVRCCKCGEYESCPLRNWRDDWLCIACEFPHLREDD
jgi:hypothetical protein